MCAQVKDALDQFDAALKLSPDQDEAQAALYNKACCHAYRSGLIYSVPTTFIFNILITSDRKS